MASEQEELRLVVNLTDNASAGIAKLRSEFAQLGQGQTSQSLDKFKRETTAITSVVKGLGTELGLSARVMTSVLVPGVGTAVAAIGALGALYIEQLRQLPEWTNKLRAMGDAARNIGANAGQYRSIVEQLGALGVSAEAAQNSMAGINNAIADLTRRGSPLRQTLLAHAGPEGQAGMRAFIDSLLTAGSEAQRTNRVIIAGENVYQNALKETRSELEARRREQEWLKQFGVDPSLAGKRVKELSAEEQAAANVRNKNAKEFADLLGGIGTKFEAITDMLKDPLIGENSMLVKGLKLASKLLDEILGLFGKVGEVDRKLPAPKGLRDQLNPFNQQNIDREKAVNPDLHPSSYSPGGGGYGGMLQNANFTSDGAGGVPRYGGGGGGMGGPYGQTAGPGTGDGAGATAPSGGGGNAGPAAGFAGGNLSREQFDKTFAGTPLAGHYDTVVASAAKHGVPASLVAGIMAHETGAGTSRMLRERNNPAGLMDPKTGMRTGKVFGSIDEGIASAAGSIAKNFVAGGSTIGGMANLYAPQGAANDPGGLNKGWAGGVNRYTRQFTEGAPQAAPGGGGNKTASIDPTGGIPQTSAVPSAFAEDLKAMTLNGAQPHNIHAYMMQHGINLSLATCGQFMASVVREHGGTPPAQAATASQWNLFGGKGGAGYSSDPNAINIAVKQGTPTGQGGSHVTSAIPILDKDGKVVGFRGVGVNQGNPSGPEHGVGQFGRDVITSNKLSIGTGHGQYQIRHQIIDDRKQVDGSQVAASKVEGTGKLTVDVNAPKGTNVGAEGGGLFKNVEVNRQTQMEQARVGPAAEGISL